MKKILFVLAVASIGMVSSCKKEDSVKPVNAEKVMAGGKTDMTDYN